MKYILIIILQVVVLSCSNSNKPVQEQELLHKTISEEIFIGRGGIMTLLSDSIIVGIDDNTEKCFFRLNNNLSNLSICNFGNKGQGPDDFIFPSSIQRINENTMGCYDAALNKYSEIELSGDCIFKTKNKINFSELNFRVIKIKQGKYIGLGLYSESMFMLFDSVGTAIKSFFEYPYKDKDEKSIENRLRAMAYQGFIAANPDKTKFIYTTDRGNIIHFYDIVNDTVKIIKKIENSYPNYVTEVNDHGFSAPLKKSNKTCYVCAFTTGKYVYLLYSGKTFAEASLNAFNGETIFVYDWTGELKSACHLDIPCSYFCVSSDYKRLWAIANDPDPKIVYFDF
ncbi:MAG: TolB-like 6-bladed beta-propeller domain-containing protein [Dysgonamonadaceae bacterium]|jgi:hypothetical protein|nr:TolB-like 6-bladed beta-propeller domain-containing protein [Dysgonamonadaceae bacterium]